VTRCPTTVFTLAFFLLSFSSSLAVQTLFCRPSVTPLRFPRPIRFFLFVAREPCEPPLRSFSVKTRLSVSTNFRQGIPVTRSPFSTQMLDSPRFLPKCSPIPPSSCPIFTTRFFPEDRPFLPSRVSLDLAHGAVTASKAPRPPSPRTRGGQAPSPAHPPPPFISPAAPGGFGEPFSGSRLPPPLGLLRLGQMSPC